MALTKVIGSGVGTLASNVAVTSDDPTITMTDSSGTNDIVTLQSTSGALIVTARDGSSNGEIIFKADTGSAVTEHMRINNIGAITKPLQPAFYAETASSQSNIALNTAQTLAFGGEIFDQNADFASNTFTAPLSGRYFLHTTLRFEAIDTAANYVLWGIVTSNREFYSILDPQRFSADVNYYSVQQTVLADMDASDTAHVVFLQSGGTQQTDLQGADGYSYFCGHLVA